MPGRTDDPRWAVFLTCVVSHLPMLGVVTLLVRKKMRFEAMIGAYAVTVSFMYHACECFQTSFFLSELRWHRLDNIGAISSLGCSCIHLACFESRALLDYLQYAVLFAVIIVQEAAPWDVTYTIVPVAACICVPVVSHLLNRRRRQGLVLRRFFIGLAACAVGIFFFVLGLDDMSDPVRIFHGLFHICIAATIFFFFFALRPHMDRKRTPPGSPRYDDPVAVVLNL